jgi:hypothetical protein
MADYSPPRRVLGVGLEELEYPYPIVLPLARHRLTCEN